MFYIANSFTEAAKSFSVIGESIFQKKKVLSGAENLLLGALMIYPCPLVKPARLLELCAEFRRVPAGLRKPTINPLRKNT